MPVVQQPGATVTASRIRSMIERMLANAMRSGDLKDVGSIKKYLVLSTPRTGSTMFCRALEGAGLGWPVEWFNPLYMTQAQAAAGAASLDLQQYVNTVILGTYNAKHNVFGVNVHVDQYLFLKRHNFDLFSLGFDRVYYVYRRNKVNQAYSLAKSRLTGFWSREAEVEAGHTSPIKTEVSASALCSALTNIVAECEVADTTLSERISRRYCFEEFVTGSLTAAVSSISRDLGILEHTVPPSFKTERQSSDYDTEQIQRILAYLGWS